jgi:hypothetical protein
MRMVNRGSNDNFGPSVGQIAQRLIEASKRDPTLLSRVQASGDRLSERATEFQGSARKRRSLSYADHHLAAAARHLAAEADPYMEQLASIAIASARRAENASERASETSRIAKRATMMMSVFGVIGGLVGIAGIVDHRFNDRLKPASTTLPSKVQSTTAQMPDAMVGGVPTPPANTVIARSAAGRLDEPLNPTAAPTMNQALQTTSVPIGPTGVRAFPTRPYGFNASTSQNLASRRAGLDQPHPAEAVLSRLRVQARQGSTVQAVAAQSSGLSDQPQQLLHQASQTSFSPPQAYATQSALIPSSSANLITVRQLLVSGRADEARDLLVRVQTQMVFQPVAPDQPVAEGGNVAATRVGDAIRMLDQGNTGSAIRAINLAMNGPTAEQGGDGQRWQRYSASVQPWYVYPLPSNYYDGYGLR